MFMYVLQKKIKNYKKGDKVYQLLVHGQWFSPDSPASSTTKTGRHDIAKKSKKINLFGNHRGHDPTVVGLISTYEISAYHH